MEGLVASRCDEAQCGVLRGAGIQKRFRALIVIGCLLASFAVRAPDSDAAVASKVDADALQKALVDALPESGASGVSAAIVFEDGSKWQGTSGFADTESGRAVKRSTPFAIASVSKTFAAALALHFVERGALDLDEPIAQWLPDFPGADRITLRALLGHSSGLGDVLPGRPSTYRWQRDAVLVEGVEPVCEPEECFNYADANFVAVGAVIEALTGQPYERVLRRVILGPLGLEKTWSQEFEPARGRVALHHMDEDDRSGNEPSTEFVTRTGAAGGMASTASDLASWGNALFGGRVLQRSSLEEMTDFDATADLLCRQLDRCAPSYGLGMGETLRDGWTVWEHSGSTGALLTYFPEQRITIAVLTNGDADTGPGDPGAIMSALTWTLSDVQTDADVYMLDRDGGQPQRLRHPGFEFSPSISPDGTRLVFSTNRDGDNEIATADLHGTGVRVLTRNRASDGLPAWSPHGTELAFVSDRGGDREIYVMNADGTQQRRLTTVSGNDEAPSWSPDGSLIVFDHHDGSTVEIWVTTSDGSDARLVTRVDGFDPNVGHPSWSPDGSRVVFSDYGRGQSRLLSVAIDGSNLTTRITKRAPLIDPFVSKDGTIVFETRGDLYVLAPDSDETTRLTRTVGVEFRATWSPDGQRLVYARPGDS